MPARSTDSSCQLVRHLVPSCNKIKAAAKKAAAKRKSPPEYCPVRCLIAPRIKGKKKASQAAGRADQSGENPDAFGKSLWQQLKHSSVPHAHHSHGQK